MAALLLGKGGVKVQHERIGVGAEFRDDERHALCHQPGDEGDIARQPVELGDDHGAALAAGQRQRLGEARALVEGIRSLARLDLHERADQFEILRLGETLDRDALGVGAEPRAALALGRDTVRGPAAAQRCVFCRPLNPSFF